MTAFTESPQIAGLNALIEEGDEKLVWVTPTAPLSFRFEWRKVLFTGRLSEVGNDHRLLLIGDMGPLPFSAEDPAFRERLLQLVKWKPNDRVRFVLEPIRHRIFLTIDDILTGEFHGVDLISSTVASLYHLRAYMELARDIGWQHPSDRDNITLNTISKDETN